MYNSYFFQRYILTENSFHSSNPMKTEVVQEKDHTTKLDSQSIYVPLLFTPLFLMILWAIAALIVPSNRRKFPENAKVISNRFKQVPCKNCQFFKDNHYLNCAVNPCIVLTKEALNCSDYLPNSSINESESTDDHLR
ncbi:MAG: hypothetical protein DSM106950_31280 [Stigonema ocellatum SAG 48.90 = DSM 106950]|nr:hypothetical protein [Stigonema ocellatum SAG 48.90 = DSM 106950]